MTERDPGTEPDVDPTLAARQLPTGTVHIAPAGTPAEGVPIGSPVWVEAGTVTEDGLRGHFTMDTGYHLPPPGRIGGHDMPDPRSYATRATAGPDQVAEHRADEPGGVDDIAATIEGLCACPCRQPLDPDGPSAYYASPACQAQWMSQHANRPEEVQQRPDAAPVYVGADTARVPLRPSRYVSAPTAAPEVMNRTLRDAGPAHRARRDTDLTYRRFCRNCDTTEVPDTTERVIHERRYIGPEPTPDAILPPNITIGSRLHGSQSCGSCSQPFAGPAFTANVDDEPSGWRLRLADGTFWTSYLLSRAELERVNPAVRRRVVDAAWRHMQAQLVNRGRSPELLSDLGHLSMVAANPNVGFAYLASMSVLDPRNTIRVTDVP